MRNERRRIALEIVLKAGDNLLNHFGKKIPFKKKGSLMDLVSDADINSEEFLISVIKKIFPEDGILSEEMGRLDGKNEYRWILDPLDGTHNFLAKLPQFGVSVAVEKDGVVICGACYFPMLGEHLTAWRGGGAYLNHKRITVSSAKNLKGGMFFSDSIMRNKPEEIMRDIARFCGAGCRLRVFGSSLLAFTRVAAGQAVVATNRLGHPWDIAAAALMVEEAGGKVTDELGEPWSVNSANLLATNRAVHEAALTLFARN